MDVLLVEDNAGDQRLIATALAREAPGVSLHVARDGVQALAFLRRERGYEHVPRPSFVLLDLKLPRKGGLEVLDEVKRDPRLRRIPVIVLSSSRARSDIATAYERQAAAYFAKPMSDFGGLVKRIVGFMEAAQAPAMSEGADPPPAPARERMPERTEALRSTPRSHHRATIVEAAADAILSVELDGTIASWNPAAEQLFGYTAAEAIGKNVRVLVANERAEDLMLWFAAVLDGGRVERFETVRVNRELKRRAISLAMSPIRDMRGSVAGVVMIARDVTEQKQAEERFRLAVESSPSAMVMVDSAGTIVLVNAEAERLFGYQRGELIGQSIELLVPDRFRTEHPSHRDGFTASPHARAMGAGRELYAVRKDGSEFPVEIGLNPIETPQGTLVLSAIVDITERKQAEERFRLAVESSPNGVVLVGTDGRIILVNAETERVFGWTREEIVGKPIEVLVPGRFRGQHPHHRDHFFEKPRARAMGAGRDLYAARKDGSEFPVEIGLNPIETPQGTLVLSAIVDITERKQVEKALSQRTRELERSNQELEQFAYVASHDLQEPLRMVASFTRLLDEDFGEVLGETGREYIKFAFEGAIRMQRLLDDLLAYSRVTTRGNEPSPVAADVALDAAVENLELVIAETGADITRAPLPTLLADETQLIELFQNLLSNAIKFRGDGAPRVHVSARREGDGCVLSVSDSGIGIDPAYSDEIFEVFKRAHGPDEYPGTGIGLAICHRIVERLGGRIWVESEPGQGATFCFWLRTA